MQPSSEEYPNHICWHSVSPVQGQKLELQQHRPREFLQRHQVWQQQTGSRHRARDTKPGNLLILPGTRQLLHGSTETVGPTLLSRGPRYSLGQKRCPLTTAQRRKTPGDHQGP